MATGTFFSVLLLPGAQGLLLGKRTNQIISDFDCNLIGSHQPTDPQRHVQGHSREVGMHVCPQPHQRLIFYLAGQLFQRFGRRLVPKNIYQL